MRQFEAQDIAVEVESTFKVGHFEMDMADAYAGINGFVRGRLDWRIQPLPEFLVQWFHSCFQRFHIDGTECLVFERYPNSQALLHKNPGDTIGAILRTCSGQEKYAERPARN